MSHQDPSDPSPKNNDSQGSKTPATRGGINWRVVILMTIALGILYYAASNGFEGEPKEMTYEEFLNNIDSGKIITDHNLPKNKDGKTFPNDANELKKGGMSPTVPIISGYYYKEDPWKADKDSPQQAFRIPINTQLDDDQLKSIQLRHPIPLQIVKDLPASTDGKLLTLRELSTLLARDAVIKDDPENPFEMVSLIGSEDKFIVGKYYAFPAADAITEKDQLAPFTIAVNNFELANAYDKQVINKLAPFKEDSGMMRFLLVQMLPILLIIVIIFFLFRHQMKSAGRGAMSFGKSKARLLSMDGKKVTFKDVAGIEESKEELVEIVDYLRDPKKFQKLGANLPKGLLMVGPPGTGKTLLARAIAGEADVPFFSISGSDFVEMFVGVGASRVRDMFEQGQKNSPCLIFIDEIDAVGRHRGHGMGVDTMNVNRRSTHFSSKWMDLIPAPV